MQNKWIVPIVLLFLFKQYFSIACAQTTYLYHHRNVNLFSGFNTDNGAKAFVTADEHYLLFHADNSLLVYDLIDRYPVHQLPVESDYLCTGNIGAKCLLRITNRDKVFVALYDIGAGQMVDTLDSFDVAATSKYNDHYLFDSRDDNILLSNADKIALYNLHSKKWKLMAFDPTNTEIINFCGPDYLLYQLNDRHSKDSINNSPIWIYGLKTNHAIKMAHSEQKAFVVPENVAVEANRFIYYDSLGYSNIAEVRDSLNFPSVRLERFPYKILSLNKAGNLIQYQVRDKNKQTRFITYDLSTRKVLDTLTTRIKYFPSSNFGYDLTYLRGKNGFQVFSLDKQSAESLYAQNARINTFKPVQNTLAIAFSDSTLRIVNILTENIQLFKLGFSAAEISVSRDNHYVFAYHSRNAFVSRLNLDNSRLDKVDLTFPFKEIGQKVKLHEISARDSNQLLIIQKDKIYHYDIRTNRITDSTSLSADASYGSSYRLDDSLIAVEFKSYRAFSAARKDTIEMDALAINNYQTGKVKLLVSAENLIRLLPPKIKTPHFIEFIGSNKQSELFFLFSKYIFKINITTDKTVFIDSVKSLPGNLYFDIYSQQKNYFTGSSFIDLYQAKIDSLNIDQYAVGYFYHNNFVYLDKNNGQLNIAAWDGSRRQSQLSFANRLNRYLVKSENGEFDGSKESVNDIYFNINNGASFINADEYFGDLYEPYLLRKLFTGYRFPALNPIFKYLPSHPLLDSLKAGEVRVENHTRNSLIFVKNDEIVSDLVIHSHVDSIFTSKAKSNFSKDEVVIEEPGLYVHNTYSTALMNNQLSPEPDKTGTITMLSVCIDKYPAASGMPLLNSCYKSALKLSTYLKSNEAVGTALILRDSAATKLIISHTIDSLNNDIHKSDTFVLYLVGHGIKSEIGSKFYYIPFDGTLRGKKSNCMSSFDIAGLVQKLKFKHVVVIVDACYAAALIPTFEKVASYKAKMDGVSISLLLSSDKNVSNYQNNNITDYLSKLLYTFDTFKSTKKNRLSLNAMKKFSDSVLKSKGRQQSSVIMNWGNDYHF